MSVHPDLDLPPIQLYDVNEVCERLRISRTSFYGLVRDGQIVVTRIGRLTRVSHANLLAYVNRSTLASPAQPALVLHLPA